MTPRRIAALLLAATLVAGCGADEPAADAAPLPDRLAARVTVDGMWRHLQALQDIADAHGGNRAEGRPGYDASVDYAAKTLRDNGFDVSTPEFSHIVVAERGRQTLTVAGRDFPVEQAALLVTTPPEGLRGRVVRPRRPAGCTADDYRGVAVRGALAVVDDRDCPAAEKHRAAADSGATGLLIVGGAPAPADLFGPHYYDALTLPVAVIRPDADAALRRTDGEVVLRTESRTERTTSRNVLARTVTGATDNMVVFGAHLDSVVRGPGINDNGTGVAAVLETAAALGASPGTANAVQFALWGGEEAGLYGSTAYVDGLGAQRVADIAVYLNADMLGSPNPGYFTYDGDQSGEPSPTVALGDVPAGSAGVERTLAGYLNLAGKRPADQPFGVSSDYSPFLRAGVAVGGVTTGNAQRKTTVQQRLWGGEHGVAFDPNYHSARDTIDNVDRDALAVMASALAFAVGTYAESTDGVNGVPPRGERSRP
ncbi:M20/M25/M40 family metallo-hydrolase [Mycobacterium sp. MYCO198283]|uniref:M28 family peptidase n=1 Tax=Mycobacterium sp. MYCO198283 TaxID=2883505 RepID=UPI001E63CCC5|nr:M28 family peptidase [Mycobacterium sp. MYCO198283]MCG5432200.1 M20/M25/M40 family metallo-hydrolase [Mycobacterium sp. MYCO198283]